jgi:hypothetical protein
MESFSDDDFSGFARQPSAHHWQMLRKLDEESLSPNDFLNYWRLNNSELARILGCDRKTVRSWLARKTEPNLEQKRRLGLVHKLWSRV